MVFIDEFIKSFALRLGNSCSRMSNSEMCTYGFQKKKNGMRAAKFATIFYQCGESIQLFVYSGTKSKRFQLHASSKPINQVQNLYAHLSEENLPRSVEWNFAQCRMSFSISTILEVSPSF